MFLLIFSAIIFGMLFGFFWFFLVLTVIKINSNEDNFYDDEFF